MSALWYLSRATGVMSVVLLTAVMILGLLLSGARRRAGNRTTMVQAIHRSLALGMLVFLAVHIGTAIIDTYVHIDVLAVVLPFTSSYKRLNVGIGTLGLDVLLAIIVSSLLRHRLNERVWRLVHRAAFVMWPLVLWHGIAMSTANERLLRFTTIGCGIVAVAAVVWRLLGPHHDSRRRREVLRQEWT